MQNRLESDHSAFHLLPKEIWQLIFQLSNINLRDITSILQTSFALAQFADEVAKAVYIKHFPHLYRKLPGQKKKSVTLSDLKEAYEDDYTPLTAMQRNIFTLTKDGELEKIQSLPWSEIFFITRDASGFTIVDWARKKGHISILNYCYSKYNNPWSNEYEYQVGYFYNYNLAKLRLAIQCLQPLIEINGLISSIEKLDQIARYMGSAQYTTAPVYLEIYDSAASTGHIELLTACLTGGKYRSKIVISDWLRRPLKLAIQSEQLAIIKLLLRIQRRIQESVDNELISYALEVGNKDILWVLLNEPNLKITSLLDVLEADLDMMVTVLTHPNFKLTEPLLQNIEENLHHRNKDLEKALTLIRIVNISLDQYLVNKLFNLAFEQNYLLQTMVDFLIGKNVDQKNIKFALSVVFVRFIFINKEIDMKKLLKVIPLMIEYDFMTEFEVIPEIIELILKQNEFSKPILSALSVSRVYQAKVVEAVCRLPSNYGLLNILMEMGYADDSEFRNIIFHVAAKNGMVSLVQQIIRMPGHDVNVVDINGRTALILAAQSGHLKVVAVLYSVKDLDVDFKHNGVTAQGGACTYRDVYNWMELQRLKKEYENREDSLLANFTLFDLGRKLGAYSNSYICAAIDALSAVILGEASLESVREYDDVLESGYIGYVYKEILGEFSPHPNPLPQ